jgi:GTPase SAR1 family protein
MYVALVYDISSRKSFETIQWWFAERSQLAPKSAVKILVGNKVDNVRLHLVSTVPTLKGSP